MSSNWPVGSTPAWRRIRRDVLARDGYRCQYNMQGCTKTSDLQVHHTHGRGVTGDDPRYLKTACRNCNTKIGDPTRLPDPPHIPVTKW